MAKFASFIGPIGAGIGAAISFILIFLPEQKSPVELKLDKLTSMVKEMHVEMTGRLTKIENLIENLKAEDVIMNYKTDVNEKMELLLNHYYYYLENVTNSSLRSKMIDSCSQFNPELLMQILSAKTKPSERPSFVTLQDAIYKLYFNINSNNLLALYSYLVSDTMKLLELASVCSNISSDKAIDFDIASEQNVNKKFFLNLPLFTYRTGKCDNH